MAVLYSNSTLTALPLTGLIRLCATEGLGVIGIICSRSYTFTGHLLFMVVNCRELMFRNKLKSGI